MRTEETYRCIRCCAEFPAVDRPEACPHDGAPLSADGADPFRGMQVGGRFKVTKYAAAGGCATVYQGLDEETENVVAVKILHDHLSLSGEHVKRFQREAAALQKLRHTNIAEVLAYGFMPRGQPYIVMEWLRTGSIQDRLDKGETFSVKDTFAIAHQLCDALMFAHQNGVIHRDLKPSNVLFDNDTVKLVDFGLAKASGTSIAGSTLTNTGMIVGTPAYMSPEQCLGHELEARSDVYSLGCILYEMLMGKKPFAAFTEIDFMRQHVHDAPKSFAETRTDIFIPVGLESIVMRALQKDRELRFANVKAMKTSLEHGSDITNGLQENPVAENRKKPAAIAMAGSGMVIAIGIAAWICSLQKSSEPKPTSAFSSAPPIAIQVGAPQAVIPPGRSANEGQPERASHTSSAETKALAKERNTVPIAKTPTRQSPLETPNVKVSATPPNASSAGQATAKQALSHEQILRMYSLDSAESEPSADAKRKPAASQDPKESGRGSTWRNQPVPPGFKLFENNGLEFLYPQNWGVSAQNTGDVIVEIQENAQRSKSAITFRLYPQIHSAQELADRHLHGHLNETGTSLLRPVDKETFQLSAWNPPPLRTLTGFVEELDCARANHSHLYQKNLYVQRKAGVLRITVTARAVHYAATNEVFLGCMKTVRIKPPSRGSSPFGVDSGT